MVGKQPSKEETVVFTIRLPRTLIDELRRRAANDDRSVNSYIVRSLTQHVEETGE